MEPRHEFAIKPGEATMNSRKLFAASTMVLAYLAAEPSAALPVISTGPFMPSSPTFVVPIEIIDASDLVTWQFDLSFNPNDFQINLLCDSSTDSFCDPINGPVTEGPFTSKNGTALSLFVPGFADNGAGLLSIVSGAYVDIPPGPSGDGILAFVEFERIGAGDSLITVQNASVTQGTSAVDEPPVSLLVFATLISAVVSRRRSWRSSQSASLSSPITGG